MVLLVVDTQKGIVDERLYAFEKFVSNIRELIRTAREQGIEVVYVQHDDGPGTGFSIGDDEFEVYSGFAPLLTEKRFVKTVCSAFKKESGLLEYLTEKGEKDVMVCGIMTDFCINATVEAGFEHGLHMIVPAYANSTQDNEYMTAFNRNFGDSSGGGGGGGNHNNNGGGGGDGSGCGCLIAIAVVVVLILIVLGG